MVVLCEHSYFTHGVTLLVLPTMRHTILYGVELSNQSCPSGATKGTLLAMMKW
jgi:hypothetical protein